MPSLGGAESDRTLERYAKAMERMAGPKCDNYQNALGLGVKELVNYPNACFAYICTTSGITRKSEREGYAHRYHSCVGPTAIRFFHHVSLASDSWK